MRVLIISALLAYAAAAPSGIVAPLIYHSVAIPASVPTISPGDIQAAAIDAQVKINDLARAAADKAQELADQAVENVNEKVVTDVNQANEKSLEAFWSNEDKKWQALDALKTAEAQIDGAAASNAQVNAKIAVGGVVPYVAAVPAPLSPVIAPIPPVVYTPYLAGVKSVTTQTLEVKSEEKNEKKEEAVVKTAEPEKTVEAEKGEVVEAATEKTETKPVVLASPVVAPFASVYRYDVAFPAVGHVVAQPVVNYATSYQQINGIAPTFVKTVW
ncbi:pupal cuticle protein PCP52-like isoform X2 [Anticarsia gemmatalis]|uniref:pupal cuticle protein PCP52-like isoform X1 n=1 Tax=Anticarsia gemmatalis TaxID=129554 RepID=UPI003F75955E